MVNLTKNLTLWFQLHKRSQWDWHKWVNTMGILLSSWHLVKKQRLRKKRWDFSVLLKHTNLSVVQRAKNKINERKVFRPTWVLSILLSLYCQLCFSFWLRCCKEENYLSALLLTIFYICLVLFFDLLKEYAGSGFWLDFSGFMFFLHLIFFFVFCFFKTDKLNFFSKWCGM